MKQSKLTQEGLRTVGSGFGAVTNVSRVILAGIGLSAAQQSGVLEAIKRSIVGTEPGVKTPFEKVIQSANSPKGIIDQPAAITMTDSLVNSGSSMPMQDPMKAAAEAMNAAQVGARPQDQNLVQKAISGFQEFLSNPVNVGLVALGGGAAVAGGVAVFKKKKKKKKMKKKGKKRKGKKKKGKKRKGKKKKGKKKKRKGSHHSSHRVF